MTTDSKARAGSHQRTFEGEVINDVADKTVSVLVRKKSMHSLYKKYFTKSFKYLAHDPDNSCKVGDLVRIEECRPMSKRKNWRVTAVIKRTR
jgi:small subunit ribosomal protein S17